MNPLNTALYARLTSDPTFVSAATGGLHYMRARHPATYPLVIFSQYAVSIDDYTFAGRVWGLYPYQFVVADEGDSVVVANTILDRIDVLLTDHALSVGGSTLFNLRRSGRHPDRDEIAEGGKRLLYVGANFDVELG